MLAAAFEAHLVTDSVVAQSGAEARRLWSVRDAPGEFPRILWPHVAFDVGLPIGDIGRFIEACSHAIYARWPGATTAFFGHVGDSNLHLTLKACDGSQPEDEINDLVCGCVRLPGHHLGRARHRSALAPISRALAFIGGDRRHARAEARAGSKGILNPGKVL
jgi:FAD/FMN-containing dehydrogenase